MCNVLQLKAGRLPVIDQFRPRHSKRMYGVPCGGMGSGTVGRQVHKLILVGQIFFPVLLKKMFN